ncbi:DUF3219 family protein [Saccharibacillus qingshengii]|uniref:DUF3219 family protein n=1 Tax=Saccharibacillus qingshengii TaxID=1763540 RepID=UPI00155317AC|nr:DUF3219 family protein [Saccharibacillus qingshengii]
MNTNPVWIDDRRFEVTNLREFTVGDPGQERRAVAFDFKVTHDEYHDVATLLYRGTFRVLIPQIGFEQAADIHNYSTSLDNLYEEGAVGDYHLELAERR